MLFDAFSSNPIFFPLSTAVDYEKKIDLNNYFIKKIALKIMFFNENFTIFYKFYQVW